MLTTVRRLAGSLRNAVLPARWPVDPHGPEEVRQVVVTHGAQIRNIVYAVLFILVTVPALTWLVLTVGQRSRGDNCDTVERSLIEYNEGLIDRLVEVSGPPAPEDVDKRAAQIEVLVAGGRADIVESMAGCTG